MGRLEESLRVKYAEMPREAMKALVPIDAYIAYYKRFGYTYHVLAQMESITKGRRIPDALPPVAAMFMAELENGILTAGHDLDKVRLPLRTLIATGEESYVTLSGKTVPCVAGDWLIADEEGVLSSILRGPDLRTAITGETRRLLYTAYAPEGVPGPVLERHLSGIEAALRLFAEMRSPAIKMIAPMDGNSMTLNV